VYVTSKTPKKDGVRNVEVRDRVYESGILTEDTLDWYAQDDQGSVWYLGEFSTEFPSGDHTGSWTAGVDGAQPGYIMEAAPQVGDNYCQENARASRRTRLRSLVVPRLARFRTGRSPAMSFRPRTTR
jgi:hypothetical protein